MSRFDALRVFERGGVRIAHVRDVRTGRDLYVSRHEGIYVHWDRLGASVELPDLRLVAAKALNSSVGRKRRMARRLPARRIDPVDRRRQNRQRVAGGGPAVIQPVKRSPRPCRKCGEEFEPKGPTSKVCQTCKSEAGRQQAISKQVAA